MLKVLQVHVYYTTSSTSGENSTVQSIGEYLNEFSVADTLVLNAGFLNKSIFHKIAHTSKMFLKFISLLRTYKRYDVIFFHNQIPFIPAWTLAVFSRKVKVVKVWHNVRPFCISGSAFLKGKVCWKCTNDKFGKFNSVLNRCYRNSFYQTVIAQFTQIGILKILKGNNIYHVTVSEFLKGRLIAEGFKQPQVFSIQNASRSGEIRQPNGHDFVFVGRITVEKGIVDLLLAWKHYKSSHSDELKLHIVGDGPLLGELREKFADSRTIFHGFVNSDMLYSILGSCKIGIIPNRWEEPFGKVALDFLESGLGILSVKSGGLLEILQYDLATRFITSLLPERLADEMYEFSNSLEVIDISAREGVLLKFEVRSIRSQWRDLLLHMKVS